MTAVDLAAEFLERHGPLRDRGWSQRVDGMLLPPGVEPDPPKPTGIDLFCGAGGFSCGFEQAGFHVIGASEWWPIAVETYLCNLGSPTTRVYVGETAAPDWTRKEKKLLEPHMGSFVLAGDLWDNAGDGWISKAADHEANDGTCGSHIEDAAGREWFHKTYCLGGRDHDAQPSQVMWMCDVGELTGDRMLDDLGVARGDVGCVFGGPPCQGFSTANIKAGPNDSRNQLVFEFARLVCEIQPKAMCMENVPAIATMLTPEGVPVIDALAMILEEGGMGTYKALRSSLRTNAGAGAVLRGKPAPERDIELEEDEVDEPAQLALEVTA